MAREDQRSATAQAYRRLYNSARWKALRKAQLDREPLCRMCLPRVTAATVADHVEPHRGDERLFFEGKLQSLCKPHHDATKQRSERHGFEVGCDVAGRPVDPAHPWNARNPRRGAESDEGRSKGG